MTAARIVTQALIRAGGRASLSDVAQACGWGADYRRTSTALQRAKRMGWAIGEALPGVRAASACYWRATDRAARSDEPRGDYQAARDRSDRCASCGLCQQQGQRALWCRLRHRHVSAGGICPEWRA